MGKESIRFIVVSKLYWIQVATEQDSQKIMKELRLEDLQEKLEGLMIDKQNSYIQSYPYFIDYFKEIETIERKHLMVSIHFVYGWMPTILKHVDLSDERKVLSLLNDVKKGVLLREKELEILKLVINNSMVGLSKLLHFINPEIYPIWDSKIMKSLTNKKSIYGIGKPKLYLEYLNHIHQFTKHNDCQKIQSLAKEKLGYEISKIRTVEFIIFNQA